MITEAAVAHQVSERPATALDEGFFRSVVVADRVGDFLVALPRDQAEALAADQFRLQTIGYAQDYPHASHRVVLWHGRPVGRVIDADQGNHLLAVDLVIDPAARGLGIGTEIMQRMQEKARASGRPLRLCVLIDTPAVRLHESLGFRPMATVGNRLEMEWAP
jgi:GNAT superfamily N-acetyltransferase